MDESPQNYSDWNLAKFGQPNISIAKGTKQKTTFPHLQTNKTKKAKGK
jgi:hypothetical protein